MPVECLRRCAAGLATATLLLTTVAAHAQPRPQTLAACAACHGRGGNAQTPQYPSIAGQPKVFIENQLVLIREGLRDIPPMKEVMAGMRDEDIVALAEHFAAQPIVPRPAPVQPQKYRLGEETSRKMLCGTCHLADYTGQQQVPRLAGQNEDYLLQAMKQFRDNPGPGRDTIMAASLYGLKDADLANLAHYFASYKPL
jgi:cytochrome c553